MTGSGPASPLPDRWQWWEDGAHDGITNMAIDQALHATVQPRVGTWRWYSWETPTVSFGRNERLAGRVSAERLASSGLGSVRRPTGGRALLHARELTYSVTMPLSADSAWRIAYDAVNAILLDGLKAAGVSAELAQHTPVVAPDGPVCFDQPAAGEITVGGRKLVGSAVWRQGDRYLQHGSILLHDDQHLLDRVIGSAASPPPAGTLSSCFPGADDHWLAAHVKQAMRAALARLGDVRPREESVGSGWQERLASHHWHFSDPAWLWRR